MATQRDTAGLESQTNSVITTNGVNGITGAILNLLFDDYGASLYNILDYNKSSGSVISFDISNPGAGDAQYTTSAGGTKFSFGTDNSTNSFIVALGAELDTAPLLKIQAVALNLDVGAVGVIYTKDDAGDVRIRMVNAAAQNWAYGIDDDDSDAFKISASPDLGTSDKLQIQAAAINVDFGAAGIIYTRADAGDLRIRMINAAAQNWAYGIDDDDSDAFKISASANLGTLDAIRIDTSRAVSINTSFQPPAFTVAGLPSVSTGGLIYVSDETSGATMAFSDGTNWRRVQDRAIVS